eukprot:scaffold121035_cov57-Phaeocystis_antarctica.AAC.4
MLRSKALACMPGYALRAQQPRAQTDRQTDRQTDSSLAQQPAEATADRGRPSESSVQAGGATTHGSAAARGQPVGGGTSRLTATAMATRLARRACGPPSPRLGHRRVWGTVRRRFFRSETTDRALPLVW